MVPKLEDVPKDVYSLFDPDIDHTINEDNLEEFANNLKDLLRARLQKQERGDRPIRFSALGKKDRQVWMDAHPEPDREERLTPKTYLKFLYGDVIEQLLLLLVKEAGHSVEDTQKQVEVNGITGSIDALIDGVVVDVKSASSFGYKKFEERRVTEEDPFGYVDQLSGYSTVLTPGEDAAWLAMDKVHADICVSPLPYTVIKHHNPVDRIEHLKEVIESETPPELCYQPVPDGKSGNFKLDTGCGYCRHKYRCHPDLRVFLYSTGPRFLTKVVREPDVKEVTGAYLEG